jgi:hypothetical protein
LNMKAIPPFETSVTAHETAQCHISEDSHVHSFFCCLFNILQIWRYRCGHWSNGSGHRNLLSNGRLGAGISLFTVISTLTLWPIQHSV